MLSRARAFNAVLMCNACCAREMVTEFIVLTLKEDCGREFVVMRFLCGTKVLAALQEIHSSGTVSLWSGPLGNGFHVFL